MCQYNIQSTTPSARHQRNLSETSARPHPHLGLGPVACQIASIESCYQPFPFFRILLETFAIEANSISNCFRNFCNRIEANSSSHFRAIFRFDFEFQSTQTWTQIRATTRARAEIEHEFEPQFELELKSNRIESS